MLAIQTVNIHDAKSQLSRLIERVESGLVEAIVIARANKPAVKLVALDKPRIRFGIGAGKYDIPDSLAEFNAMDADIAKDFNEGEIFPGSGF